ncbi:hypothetical protein J7439_14070 [Salinisphaera sp. G21_0]|nr:hypothetical protein [Salinisphaera sp. G21_0]MBO9495804.1 hypothetical protein [Thalassotalea sp. G20_0]
MKWIDEFCDSVWSALFLCGIIFLTGMLFGAGINSQTFIITAGSIGSFLAGTGTIAALYFAKITIELSFTTPIRNKPIRKKCLKFG